MHTDHKALLPILFSTRGHGDETYLKLMIMQGYLPAV